MEAKIASLKPEIDNCASDDYGITINRFDLVAFDLHQPVRCCAIIVFDKCDDCM